MLSIFFHTVGVIAVVAAIIIGAACLLFGGLKPGDVP